MSDSFWKKEISLGRKKPAEPVAAADPVEPAVPLGRRSRSSRS